MPQALGKLVILLIFIISILGISCKRNSSEIHNSYTNSLEDSIVKLCEKGEMHINKRDYLEAKNCADKALIQIHKLKRTNQNIYRIIPYNIKANFYLDHSYDSSMVYANKALVLSKEYLNVKQEAIALNILGNAYYLTGDNKLALKVWEESLKKANKYNLEKVEAKVLCNIGVVSKIRGDYTEAIDHYQTALKTYERLQDTILIAKLLNNIGNIYFSYEIDYQKALYYYLRALNIYTQYNDSIIIADIYSNIGLVYLELKQNSKALEYLTRSYNIYKLIGHKSGVASSYTQFGEIQLMEGKYDKALNCFIKAQNIYKEIGEKNNYLYSFTQIAEVYEAMNELDKALYNHLKYLESAQNQDLKSDILGQYKEISRIYEALVDFKKALEYYKKYSKYKDSLVNETNLLQIARLETIYETEKKKKEIIQLEKDKIIQTSEIKRQKFQKTFLFNISIMCFLLTSTIFIIYRHNRKSSRILASKTIEIEEKNRLLNESVIEKETLLKEVHHRVKNNLQIISSILNLQTRYIKDKRISDQVLEGKNRVKSMALLHETLYSFNNLANVKVKPYLTKLIEYISNTYNTNGRDIQNNIDIEDIDIDIDIAIPMGLVINELISNAYKYAFTFHKKGKVQVKLKKIGDEKYFIKVSDNGIGISKNIDINNIGTLGLRLVKGLIYQINGELTINTVKGTEYIILFGKKKVS